MARHHRPNDWCSQRQDGPRTVGKGESIQGPAIHASRRCPIPCAGPLVAKRVFKEVKAIADTGFLVAFANRRDQYHSWALAIAEQVTEPLLTCEAVMAEAAFHLQSSSLVFSFWRDGLILPALNIAEHLDRLSELAARYADRKPDLADLCLIRLSELHPRYPVITTDLTDFSVYRRGRREIIPLIHPLGRHRRRGSHM